MDTSDKNVWIVPIGWGAATLVLIVVTLALDPLWSYYGSFVAGFMTIASSFKVARTQYEERRLDLEDEVLRLEVQKAKTEHEKLRADLDRRRLRQDGDATGNS